MFCGWGESLPVSTIAFVQTGTAAVASSTPGLVFLAGGGLWADALSRVVARGGGTLLLGRSEEESLAIIAVQRPAAIVAGPPLGETELVAFFDTARTASPASALIAAVSRADAALRKRLADAGVDRISLVPSGSADLAVGVVKAASLSTRAHRRIPLAVTATVVAGEERLRAVTRDLSEGGACVEALSTRVARGPVRLEFALPGERATIVATSRVAWTTSDGTQWSAGLAFEALSDLDRGRIRAFVSASG